ncbi:MAG: hypothetical protein FJ037_10070 [Chloroflexi bacterium]|nr:hypothetical protein [Chloroflexota bacterium]
MSVPPEMAGYLQAVQSHAADLARASTPEAWQRISPQPQPFELMLSARHASRELRAAIVEIAALRHASADAIARNDPDTLLYVGGHLKALDHWLRDVETSSSPVEPLLSVATGAGVQADRLAPTKGIRLPIPWPWRDPRRGRHCDPFPCIPQFRQKLPPIYSKLMPMGPKYEPATIGETFCSVWEDITPPDADTIISGVGISSGGELIEPSWGEPIDSFIANCKASGGTFDQGSAVRVGMPTSEGGHHCQFPNSCWNFLTHSGQFFRGGSPHCPHVGVIPLTPAQPATPTPTRQAPGNLTGVWAGTDTQTDSACDYAGSVRLTLNQSANAFAGTAAYALNLTKDKIGGACLPTRNYTLPVSGSVNGQTITFTIGGTWKYSGSVDGNTLRAVGTATSAGITSTDTINATRQ